MTASHHRATFLCRPSVRLCVCVCVRARVRVCVRQAAAVAADEARRRATELEASQQRSVRLKHELEDAANAAAEATRRSGDIEAALLRTHRETAEAARLAMVKQQQDARTVRCCLP
jgi:hypothetical protein